MSEPRTELERLYGHLKRLALHTVAQILEEEARTAAATGISYTAFLTRLVDAEIAAKADRSVQARIALARFPLLRTLEEFDFAFQPGLSAARVRELAELGFLARAENVVFVGLPDRGKSHLLVAAGQAAILAGYKVKYTIAAELVETLYRGLADNTVGKVIDGLLRHDAILVDELGFAPLDEVGTQLLFRFVAAAYERRSLGVASHWPFDQWGRFLPKQSTAASLLDRLLHHAVIVVTDGESFRMKEARSRAGAHPMQPVPPRRPGERRASDAPA